MTTSWPGRTVLGMSAMCFYFCHTYVWPPIWSESISLIPGPCPSPSWNNTLLPMCSAFRRGPVRHYPAKAAYQSAGSKHGWALNEQWGESYFRTDIYSAILETGLGESRWSISGIFYSKKERMMFFLWRERKPRTSSMLCKCLHLPTCPASTARLFFLDVRSL